MLHGKYFAFHNDAAHIQIQFLHGGHIALEGLAEEGLGLRIRLLLLLLCRSGSNRCRFQQRIAHGLHGLKERLPFQSLAGFDFDGNWGSKLLPQRILNLRNQLFQFFFAVCRQLNRQLRSVPEPAGTSQGTPGHGITADKKIPQLFRLDFLKFRFRVSCLQFQVSQAVLLADFSGSLVQNSPGNIKIGLQRHADPAMLGIDICSGDGRLRKGCTQLLRRLIVRKHIKEIYFLCHR